MKPTTKLRFVVRRVSDQLEVNVLQQWWEEATTVNIGWCDVAVAPARGVWRDVEVVEDANES